MDNSRLKKTATQPKPTSAKTAREIKLRLRTHESLPQILGYINS